jgi:colanic acid biosynthesis glycosyl transferase WcaI
VEVRVIRILLLNQFYWPDVAATAQLLTDLGETLVADGHEVHVVCSRGGYGGESIRLPQEERHNGVQIHRVAATGLGRRRMLHRMCDYGTFYTTALMRCLSLPRVDVCVALTTPPFVGSIGVAYKKFRRASLILWTMDLYPEIVAAMGVLRPRSIEYNLLRELAGWTYRHADRVISLADEMTARIRGYGVPAERIATIPSWSPGEAVSPCPDAHTSFRDRHGINGDFVVMYSGNMGVVHEFPTILSAARHLRYRRELKFLFVGEGTQKRWLIEEVRRQRLDNVQFCPYEPLDSLSESLGAANMHLISMKSNVEGLLVPSKLYGILAAGRPSVLVGPEGNEVARRITSSGSGWVVPPGHANKLADRIESLITRPELAWEMGIRARRHYEAWCSRQRCTSKVVDVIESAACGA